MFQEIIRSAVILIDEFNVGLCRAKYNQSRWNLDLEENSAFMLPHLRILGFCIKVQMY